MPKIPQKGIDGVDRKRNALRLHGDRGEQQAEPSHHVERPQHVRIDYLDDEGISQSIELKGFLATIFQHEIDHLQGKLYVDRLKDPSLFAFEDEYNAFLSDNQAAETG